MNKKPILTDYFKDLTHTIEEAEKSPALFEYVKALEEHLDYIECEQALTLKDPVYRGDLVPTFEAMSASLSNQKPILDEL